MKFILGVFGIVTLIVVTIILLLSLSPNAGNSNQPSRVGAVNVNDYINGTSAVAYTTQGRLVGGDQRRTIVITVSQTQRRAEVLAGYEGQVVRQTVQPNTPAGYNDFMRALQNAGFTRKRVTAQKNFEGTCPLGNIFLYDLADQTKLVSRLWNTSCNAKEGTFAGNGGLIRQVFQNQITDYSKFVQGVSL